MKIKRSICIIMSLALLLAGLTACGGRDAETQQIEYLENTSTWRNLVDIGDYVYLVGRGNNGLYRFDKASHEYELVSEECHPAFPLVLDGVLYYIDIVEDAIMRRDLSSGETETVYSASGSLRQFLIPGIDTLGFEVDGDYYNISLSEKNAEAVLVKEGTNIDQPNFMAYADSWLYFNNEGVTWRMRTDGSDCEQIEQECGRLFLSVASSDGLYYVDYVDGEDTTKLLSADGSSQPVEGEVVGAAGKSLYTLVRESTILAWLCRSADGAEPERILRVTPSIKDPALLMGPEFWVTEDWVFMWSGKDNLEDNAAPEAEPAAMNSMASGAKVYLYAIAADGSKILKLDTFVCP